MTGLIVHDSRMFLDENGNYYKISTDNEHYWRYYTIADDMRLCMRTQRDTSVNLAQMPQITLKNFKVINCPSLHSISDMMKNYLTVKQILEQEVKKADFVVLKLPGFFCDIAYQYIKKYHKPFLCELGGCPWDALWNHGLKGKIIAPFQYLYTKKIIRKCDFVLYVTERFLQRRYPTRGKSIGCSNVIIPPTPTDVLEHRIAKIKKGKHPLIIGTTAAVDVRYKGQQYIIEAMGRLKKRGITHFRYQLVGDGDMHYLQEVAKRWNVSEEVEFLGRMPKEDVFRWLETIDIYAQPSRQEGLPRALIEAMSKGLPCIGARTAGIPELLDANVIFSNTGNNINEICSLLERMDEPFFIQQARRNFQEAKKYEKGILEKKRKDFYVEFRRYLDYISL